jgi:hypothetical protein
VPNIIVEITQEKARVRALLPYLDSLLRFEAERAIRFADIHVSMNDLEGMQDSLAELRIFQKVKVPGIK